MDQLVLKRAAASRLSGEWSEDDYDVLAAGIVVGRIMKAAAAPVDQPWLWTLAYGHHEDRTPTHGYEPPREAAMAAFAKNWRRGRLAFGATAGACGGALQESETAATQKEKAPLFGRRRG